MRSKLVACVVAAWFAGVAAAFGAVWRYKPVPSHARTAPAMWPGDSVMRPAVGVANVVMFTPPQSPCTRASMAALARFAAEQDAIAQVHVVIATDERAQDGRQVAAAIERAVAIRGAQVFVDHGGVEARRFGAGAAGSTVVYGADGVLRFQGGLTRCEPTLQPERARLAE